MMMTMGTRAIPAIPWVKQTQEWVSSIIHQGREPLLNGEGRPFILSPDDQTKHLAQRLCSWVEQQDPAWVIQHEPIPRTIMAMGITGRIPFGTAPALDSAHHDRVLQLCAVLTGAANRFHGG